MERTFNIKQRNKILKITNKKTPTNSLYFTPISLKQNSESHYFTSIKTSKNNNLNDKNIDNLLNSNTKQKLSKIRNVGRNIIKSVTPNQSLKNLIDNNIYSNLSYLKLSPLPDICKNNITDSSYKENNDLSKQLQIIFSLKKKIVEMNKVVLSKNKEIEDLKRDMNIFTINQLNSEITALKSENEKLKSNINDNKDLTNIVLNDENKNNINKLKSQIDFLKKENEMLNQKYKEELDKNNILNSQINNLNKDFKIINNNSNNDYKNQKLLNQISNQEKIIKQLKEENILINKKEVKNKFEDNKLQQSNNDILEILSYNQNINKKKSYNQRIKKKYEIELIKYLNENFSILSNHNNHNNYNINNNNNNNKISNFQEYKFFITLNSINQSNNIINTLKLLTEEEYEDIELLLNIIYKIININENEILKMFNFVNNELIVIRNICNLFRIIDDAIIERFMFKISQNENGTSINVMKEKFLNIFNKAQIGINIQSMNNFINEIIEKCKNYDYKKEGFIHYYLFKNVYSQICFREKINLIPEEFNLFLSIMKKNKTNENISIYYLNYLNLEEYYNSISNQILIDKKKTINKDKNNNTKKDKNNQNEEKIVKNSNLKQDSLNLNRIRSFEQEILLINEKTENSKIINDFLDSVMNKAYERYKEKMKKKKNYSQKDLFYVKYN